MKQFTRRVRQTRRAFFDSRILIALTGCILSVALHELFHIAVHWGKITSIHFFPSNEAIVAIESTVSNGLSLQLEETIAYSITLSVFVATAAAIGHISNKKDTRSFLQTVFPKNATMQQLSSQELFELAARVNLR